MRGFLAGLVMIPLLVVGLLSIRPGGLRAQLRQAGRRLRLALGLAGVYLLGSATIRIALPHSAYSEWVPAVLAIGLAIAFVVRGQDQPAAPKA